MRGYISSQNPRSQSAAVAKLRAALRGKGDVLEPSDAEEPILAAPVRAAVFGWLAELNASEELREAGVKPRASALLSGPPGCGKTTLAHHVAARLGFPMVNIGAEHLISSGFGDSEGNVARLFDAIIDAETRCVLFLDEIDALGGKRQETGGDRGGAVGARNSMLTVLLRRIETFDGMMIAATNRPDTLDAALWRRFGMQIDVALPDDEARWAILKRYGMPFAFDDQALDLLCDLTWGAAPSLLRQLMEGVKRQIIIGERIRQPAREMAATFALIAAQCRPHPDYEPPPLWTGADLSQLNAFAWPPARTTP